MLYRFFKISLYFLAIFTLIAFFAVVYQKAIAYEGYSNQGADVSLKGLLTPKGRIQFEKKGLSDLPAKSQQKIIIGRESDKIQIKIFDEPEVFIGQAEVAIDLSKVKNSESQVTLKTYAIHGISLTSENVLGSQAVFRAVNVSQKGIWTIELNLPKGLVKPSIFQRILYWSAGHSLVWFTISILLIFITFIYIIYLLWQRKKLEQLKPSTDMLTAPPTDLSSAAVAILEQKHAAQRAIAAGILYLAARGYLAIVKTENGFLVAKHREPTELSGLDKEFYQLLIGNWFAQSPQGIRLETSRDLFSQASGQIHKELYQQLSERGLFVGDPWLTIHKTRLMGIILFLLSSIGFFLSLFILPYPPFASIIWIALMLISVIVQNISIKMPLRSPQGVLERQQWQAFKKFLEAPFPASEIELSMDIYLHYAIALNCEDRWIRRFLNSNYRIPAWYIGPSVTIEDIATDMVQFVIELSQIITEGIPPEES